MRYSKILVPLDGSELAERVVASALQLAEAMESTVTLLTVISHKSIDDPDLVAKAVQSGAFEADLYLRSVKKHFLPTMTPIETAVIIGKPEKAIIQFAQENEIDLIVMSTHGRSGITRWAFGRVAGKVLRRAPCPTVILRSEEEIKPQEFKRVLLPLDGSPLAERALEAAQILAANLEITLLLLRVVERSSYYGFGYDDKHMEEERREASAYLLEVEKKLKEQHISVMTHVADGQAADEIVDYAEVEGVDLIILSSRGYSGFDTWMFGSVAEKVMKGAPCAILVIRQEPFT